MFVALGNSCRVQQRLALLLQPAITAADAAILDGKFPSSTTADGTNFGRNLHQGTLLPLCTAAGSRASVQADGPVQNLWRQRHACGQFGLKPIHRRDTGAQKNDSGFHPTTWGSGTWFLRMGLSAPDLSGKIMVLSPCRCASVVKSAHIAAFRPPGTQTRHLTRIFTVDIRGMQALNSWRRVSDISENISPRRRGCARRPSR